MVTFFINENKMYIKMISFNIKFTHTDSRISITACNRSVQIIFNPTYAESINLFLNSSLCFFHSCLIRTSPENLPKKVLDPSGPRAAISFMCCQPLLRWPVWYFAVCCEVTPAWHPWRCIYFLYKSA